MAGRNGLLDSLRLLFQPVDSTSPARKLTSEWHAVQLLLASIPPTLLWLTLHNVQPEEGAMKGSPQVTQHQPQDKSSQLPQRDSNTETIEMVETRVAALEQQQRELVNALSTLRVAAAKSSKAKPEVDTSKSAPGGKVDNAPTQKQAADVPA